MYKSKICVREPLAPDIAAIKPTMTIKIFLMRIQLHGPKPSSQNVIISMATGIKRPRIVKQTAPIKPTNGEIVGTTIANITDNTTRIVLKT